MNAALQIAVDLEQGEIRLGTERVRLLPVAGDVFCLNDARGPLVRALKFEERSMLLGDAADRDVASLVADAALVSAGVASDDVRVAASLALAGGGEKAPAFPDCVEFVEQQYGWNEKRVGETMALVIDRLCSAMVQQDANGWKQIVFEKSDADLGTLISQMASNLSQRAVTQNREADPVTTDTPKSQSPPSHQSSHSVSKSEFEPEQRSSPAHGSMKSVSSVLPVNRVPARVLALNPKRPTAEQPIVRARALAAAANAQSETPAIASPKSDDVTPDQLVAARVVLDESVAPQIRRGLGLLSTSAPVTPQSREFPSIVKFPTNHANFSLSQTAVAATKIEPASVQPPVASFPAWQHFATPGSKPQLSHEQVQTTSRGFEAVATEAPSVNDYLAELAQLLEIECDLRGIDP